MKKFRNLVAKTVLIAFIITNILSYFPSISFAAGKNTTDKSENKHKIVNINHEKTEILIKYKDSTKETTIKENVKKKVKLKKINTKKKFKKFKIDLLEIDENDDIIKTIEELKKDPNVEFVQPNYKLDVATAPSDPMFDNQWGLQNGNDKEVEGQLGRLGVDINAINAWNLTQGSSNVTVGLLDTGVDINHEDLSSNIYVNAGEIPDNGIDDDGNGYIDDVNGWDFANDDENVYDDVALDTHGTHVAGILAASNNSTGIVGTAPNIKIMPLKFINGNWGYTCDAIAAIEYAMKMSIKIVNCSFGGTDDNYALKDTMLNSGILFVCAAGNRGSDVASYPVYPACFDIPNVLSVASIDSKGVLSQYSSYGNKIHVAAPGVNILSTTPNNTYEYFTGTSAAVPFVTGIAALLKSYLPDLNITEISQRIKNNTVPCTNLTGKVSTGGRVDAFAALTNSKPETDTYTDEGNKDETIAAGQQGGNIDTWYTMDQLAKIKEQFHYGESGVSPASGNYSFTVNDMSLPAPGFQVNISRTYNSRSSKRTPFGCGWSFGFEGYVEGTNVVDVSLPNGSVERFKLNDHNLYESDESRSTFVKNTNGTYLLTTQDQYKYTFGSSRHLVKMEDRNGNVININIDDLGRISKISDTVGREYLITYSSTSKLIENIKGPGDRTVTYTYGGGGRLSTVIDSMGGTMRYFYDSSGYLNEIQDHNYKTIQKITYNHAEGDNKDRVSQAIDSFGDVINYTYERDTWNRTSKTIITDANGRTSTYWYDSSLYPIRVQDTEGKSIYTEYYKYDVSYSRDKVSKYGDVKSTTDRNGNKTEYEIDNQGNVTKIINPDKSTKIKEYDNKNNLIKEVDECGNTTYYIYDANKVNLIKKVQPLNGTDIYTGTDSDNFAITKYAYYTENESGCAAKGLQKSETDPEGNVTTFTYDADGNVKTVSDPETNKVTGYEYNRVGWKTAEVTPKGNRIEYSYDKNGQLIKVTNASTTNITTKNETQRIVYDIMGRKIQEIAPNQYDSTQDNLQADTYNDATTGTRYEYYDSGKVKKIIDALGNVTSFTYDVYGNTLTETKPNGAICRYTYDVMDRQEKVYFKDNTASNEKLLLEYSYATLADGRTQKTETKYLEDDVNAQTTVTVYIYDYAQRLVVQTNPDGTHKKIKYNSNGTIEEQTSENGSSTFFKYDGLNRLVEQWTPLEVSDANILYSYQKTEYDKAGRKLSQNNGKEKVEKFNTPQNYSVTNFVYFKNGNVKNTTDSDGRKIEYLYDDDGNKVKESVYTDTSNALVTEYTYNYLGKISTQIQHVTEGDLYGYSHSSTEDKLLVTSYTYDKNGNIESVTTPNNVTTTYEYDALNRQLSQSQPGLDETGASVTITTSTTYDWQGQPLTKTDAKGNITAYSYNQMGLLEKITNADNGITIYSYDLLGRKIAEVLPKNYDSTKNINAMNRIEYVYDKMDRILAKKDIYLNSLGQWQTLYTKAYKYDNLGNVIKELDAVGYESGTGATLETKINTGYGIEYTYNLANLLVSQIDPVAKKRALPFSLKNEYDGLTRKISETNADGVKTGYTYDDAGNILSVSIKKNLASVPQILKSSTYDLAGRMLTQTDGNGNTTTYQYNALDKVSKTITPSDSTIASNTIIYQYDVMGNLKYQQDSMGKVDLYTYDNQGRQLTYTQKKLDNTQPITVTTKYDKNGNKCIETDENGNVQTSTYDVMNKLKTVQKTVNGIIKTTTYGYDANGNQTTVTDWLGNTSTNIYDPLNRLIEKQDPYTTIQKLEYTKNNLQSKSIDALGNVTEYLYDENNRLVTTIDPEGHTTGQSYDNVGNVETKKDGNGTATTYKYDELGRLTAVINAKSEITSYTYDLNGNMLTQTDGNIHTTAYEYNVANKITKKIDHGGRINVSEEYKYIAAKTENYTYNADGSTATMIDKNGKLTEYTYDIHGRLTSKAIGSSPISYTYDNNGNQLTITDSTGTTTRTYDEENRVLTKAVPNFGTTTYTYDYSEGNGLYSETTTDFKNNLTKKVYDKAGRLYHVIADGKTTAYEYYGNGSRKSVTYNDGAKEEYIYYKDGLNKTLINKKANGEQIDRYDYTYDDAHNQTSKIDSRGTTNYDYDSLNRLVKTIEPNGKETSYTFDQAGNRITETVKQGTNAVTTIYDYNEQNRLMSTVCQSGSQTVTDNYFYDNNGNTISKTTETAKPIDSTAQSKATVFKEGQSPTGDDTCYDEVTLYKYDVWNQLTKTTIKNKNISYSYNGEGYRVSKDINGQKTNYLYEADKVILETDGENNQTAKNVYGLNLLTRTAGSDTMNYMYNGHADVTALLNPEGIVTATYYYDAFGIVEQTGTANNNITYAGYQYDEETGLYYLNARMYDPKTARFLQEDTFTGDKNDPLSLNLYTYCANEPVMYTDPSGHKAANLNDLALASNASKKDIIWNGKDKKTGKSSATVTVNGIKQTIIVGEHGTYISKDNRIVIDNEVFDSLFSDSSKGLSVNTTISNGTLTSQTVKPGNIGSAPATTNTTVPYLKPSNRATSSPSTKSGNSGNNIVGPKVPTQGSSNASNLNSEIRVVDMKEFNSEVWTDWMKNHENGKGMTMSEYNAVYNVYSSGFRESDFASYSDYEKVVYLAAVEVYEEKYCMTPEEFFMVMFGVIAENNIKVNGLYSNTKSGGINYKEEPIKINSKNGKLYYISQGWESEQGLIYNTGSKDGNRVKHVLQHAVPDSTKPEHAVFKAQKKDILGLIDEAWSKRNKISSVKQNNGNEYYDIPMGRVVGTAGETSIRIVVEQGTRVIVTAHPIN